MTEQRDTDAARPRVEIGIDGEPYEVWDSPPPVPVSTPPVHGAPPYVPPPVGANHYRGPAERAVLDTPRQSVEKNDRAWASLGLGIAAAILQTIHLTFMVGIAGLTAFAAIAGAAYYGVRAHNAAVNGFATNPRLAYAGMVLALATLIAFAFYPYAAAAHAVALS